MSLTLDKRFWLPIVTHTPPEAIWFTNRVVLEMRGPHTVPDFVDWHLREVTKDG